MLTREDNELICRTGPGTPMGRVLRRYWHPCALSRDLPNPDCTPVRVKILGEDLVAFRDAEGRVGLIGERCPHRGASLYYGLNRDGLMCIYHGWKFDADGRCVDMPSDVPGSRYPTRRCAPRRTRRSSRRASCGRTWARRISARPRPTSSSTACRMTRSSRPSRPSTATTCRASKATSTRRTSVRCTAATRTSCCRLTRRTGRACPRPPSARTCWPGTGSPR